MGIRSRHTRTQTRKHQLTQLMDFFSRLVQLLHHNNTVFFCLLTSDLAWLLWSFWSKHFRGFVRVPRSIGLGLKVFGVNGVAPKGVRLGTKRKRLKTRRTTATLCKFELYNFYYEGSYPGVGVKNEGWNKLILITIIYCFFYFQFPRLNCVCFNYLVTSSSSSVSTFVWVSYCWN